MMYGELAQSISPLYLLHFYYNLFELMTNLAMRHLLKRKQKNIVIK